MATHPQGNSKDAQKPREAGGHWLQISFHPDFFLRDVLGEEQQEGRDGNSSGSLLGIPPGLHREEILGLSGQSRRSHSLESAIPSTEVMETPGVSLRLNSHWHQQGRLVKHEGAYAVGVTVAQSPKMSRSKTERKGI